MARIDEYTGALAAEASYSDYNDPTKKEPIEVNGVKFIVLEFYSDTIPGLQMALLKAPNGEKIVSFRGTEGAADFITDVIMGIAGYIPGVVAKQFEVAQGIFNYWKLTHGLDKNNTTIVGHSLGGSLAQFFGASTGFDTLTYNAFGMDNEIPDAAYNNVHNYKTVMDPLSSISVGMDNMIGITYEVGDKSYSDKLAHGLSNFFKNGGSIWSTGNEIIGGSDFTDTIYGNKGNDIMHGDAGNKTDTFTDYLYGGADFDTYISGDSDHITDTDGKGRVYFEGKLLAGGTKEAGAGCGPTEDDGSSVYKGDGGIYTLKGSKLTFTKDGKILTFNDYIKNDLNITLKDNEADNGACPPNLGAGGGDCPKPVNPLFNFNFSLPSPTVSVGGSVGGTYYGGGGSSVGSGDPLHTSHRTPTPPAPVIDCVNEQTRSSTGIGGGGGATSPIVLDLNRDGITSISLAASKALFDYDGDGVLENTAWTQRTDALLVNDINNDSLINNATELFGNYTRNSDGSIAKSGYQALSYYDTNSDGVVNAADTRFKELKLWVDANGDGATDAGELKTLTEMGVTSLALNNPATPYIPTAEETNTIIEETTFTDAQGEGIMRDLLFRYENSATNKEGIYFDMDGNGIKEKMTTWTDPNQWMVVKDINGDGVINSGREVVGNNMILSNGTKAADTIQALKTFDINYDGVVDTADNSGMAFWTDRNHNGLTDVGELEALGAAGAIQVIKLNPYQTLLSGYDANKDGVIDGSDAVSNYLYIQTNADQSVTLYLPDNAQARAMIAGYTGGESIQTAQGEKIIKTIQFYSGYEMSLNDALNGTDVSETLEGSSRSETLKGMGGRDILDAGAGNDTQEGGRDSDKLIGGAGNDTYVFNRGDGKDLIVESAGADTISFSAGITREDLIIKSNGIDISIYLKDGTKPLSQLTDQIIIKDWYSTGTVESIEFSDGTVMNTTSLFETSNNEDKTFVALNGVNDALIISNPQDFNVTEGLTLTSSFSYNGMGTGYQSNTYGMLVTKAYTNYQSSYLMAIDSTGKLFFQVIEANNAYHRIYSNTTLHTGELYDVAATYDKATGMSKIYINGALDIEVNVGSFNIMQSSQSVVIGAYWGSSSSLRSYLNGTVSDVQIYDRALSETEVSTINNGRIASSGLLAHYDFEGTNPFENKSGGGFMATVGGNPIISGIIETANFSDSFENITTDSTLKINTIESMIDSDISSLTLQSRYTGSGLDGASAQTVFEGVGYTGTLSNVWLKSDTLDTQYTYNGTLSDDVKALPSISGQGNVINLQEAMNEKSDLASSVTEFQNLSETGNLADFEANIDAIIEGWALYDLSGESVSSTPPIVLDLDGDGVTSTSLGTSNAYFDYDGDGRREHTAWSDTGDALLAVDLDNDGVITHGAELFGNYTLKADGTKATDGYDAMAQYDTNSDSVLNASDVEFSKLRLWKDLNQNGKNDAGELSTLAENSISTIKLSRTDRTTFTQITEAGNTITNETNYTASFGVGTVRDVWFSYDGTDTIAYSNLRDSDEKKIAIIENFYGRRLNSEERKSVEVIAEVLNQYNALRYDTIAKIITDKLYGEGFPNCQFLHDALNNTLGRVVGGAASVTETLLAVNLLAALLKREHVGVLADIYPEYFSNPTISGLLAQSNIAIGFEEGALIGHIGNRYFGTSLAETLDFSTLDGVRAYVSGGDDTIIGTKGIDEIVGGEGNDVLDGNSGNDVLDGGQGDDTLKGASTQNVYRYAWGDGNDTIIDAGSDKYVPDTLRLSDLDISRVSIERVGEDMIIHIRDEEGELLTPFGDAFGTITIKDGYLSGKIEHFYFKDTRYTFDEVLAYVPADTNYYFVKADGQVIIDEKGGDDTLHFGEGITKESIIARIVGNDLIIGLAQEGRTFDTLRDKMTILNYTDSIEHFKFQDQTDMTLDGMVELATIQVSMYKPIVDDLYVEGLEDKRFQGTITATDMSETALTYKVLSGASHGEFKIDSVTSEWEYSPNSNYNGHESVIVSVTNEFGLSDTSTILLNVIAVNDAPVTTAEESFTLQDMRIQSGTIEASDVENDTLSYRVSTAASNGVLSVNSSGAWSYTATEGYMGIDTAIITIDDGNSGTATKTLTFDLRVSAPTVDNSNAALLEDTNVSGTLNVLNPIGGALTYEVISPLTLGALNINNNGVWGYTPLENANGNENVTIKVTNSYGLSTTATLNLAIEAVNDAPIVSAPVLLSAVDEDSGVVTITKAQLLANTSDVDGDILDVLTLSASAGVLVDNLDGTWSLTPAANYHGTIDLNYIVTDGQLNITASTAQVVLSVNDAPVLLQTPTAVTLNAGTSTSGTILASDIDGDVLSYSVTTAPAHGTLSIDNNGAWNYTAERYYAGQTSATVNVNDGQGGSVATTLNFTNLMTPDWQYAYSGNTMTINDSDGIDALMMSNISMADLTFLQEGNNLRVDVKGKEDVILTDYFTSLPKGVESIQAKEGPISLIKQKLGKTGQFFSSILGSTQGDLISGTTSSETISGDNGNDILFGGLGNDTLNGENDNDLLIGGEGSDTLNGGNNNDILYGDAGNDTLNGDSGDDKFFGGLGNDTLNGDEGNDLLSGAEGTNTLKGGDGNDTYLFTKGANTTTIEDKSSSGFFFFGLFTNNDDGNDTVKFGEGITKNDISFLMSGHDLVLQYGTGELMTVKNQDNNDMKIEKFELNDGSYLTNTDMDQIIQQLTAYKADNGISITNNDQLRQNQAMMNIIASGWHTL